MAEYVSMEYPKMLYHMDGDVAIVIDPEEEFARGAGWFESPTAALEAYRDFEDRKAIKAD